MDRPTIAHNAAGLMTSVEEQQLTKPAVWLAQDSLTWYSAAACLRQEGFHQS